MCFCVFVCLFVSVCVCACVFSFCLFVCVFVRASASFEWVGGLVFKYVSVRVFEYA